MEDVIEKLSSKHKPDPRRGRQLTATDLRRLDHFRQVAENMVYSNVKASVDDVIRKAFPDTKKKTVIKSMARQNTTAGTILGEIRLNYVVEKLRDSDEPIYKIADDLHVGTPAILAMTRKEVNMTPSQLRGAARAGLKVDDLKAMTVLSPPRKKPGIESDDLARVEKLRVSIDQLVTSCDKFTFRQAIEKAIPGIKYFTMLQTMQRAKVRYKDMVDDARVKLLSKLLIETNLSISEIAKKMGYSRQGLDLLTWKTIRKTPSELRTILHYEAENSA